MLCVLRLTNTGFVQCFSLGSLLSLYANVSRFVMRTSLHKLRVCVVLAPRFPLEFCTRVFLCFACFASRTPGLYSAFPSAPFEFVRLCLSRFVMRTLPHKHRVCAVLFSPRFPYASLKAGKRNRGVPKKKRYKDQLKKQLSLADIPSNSWQDAASDRLTWRSTIRKASREFEIQRSSAVREKRQRGRTGRRLKSQHPNLQRSFARDAAEPAHHASAFTATSGPATFPDLRTRRTSHHHHHHHQSLILFCVPLQHLSIIFAQCQSRLVRRYLLSIMVGCSGLSSLLISIVSLNRVWLLYVLLREIFCLVVFVRVARHLLLIAVLLLINA